MSETEENNRKISAAYSKLSELEHEFDDAEKELLKQQITLFTPLYEKRAAVIKDIPRFWVMVLENFGPELDDHISSEDWALLGNHLTSIDVSRPDPAKNPRSFEIILEFGDNEWFEGTILKKRFDYHSFRKEGFTSLTSEPVKIKWRSEQKDLTNGINDLTLKIWEMKKSALERNLAKEENGKHNKDLATEMLSLEKDLEEKLNSTQSFFIFFSWMGRYFDVMQRSASKSKDEDEDEDETDEEDAPWEDIEVFPMGERMAYIFSDDLFPNSMKTFAETVEQENASLSEDLTDDESDASIDLEMEEEEVRFKNKNKKKRRGDNGDEEEEVKDSSTTTKKQKRQ